MKTAISEGQKHQVYSDPISKRDFEGNATVNNVKFTKANLSFCSVTFEDGFRTERFIDNNSKPIK